jgi:hypothetical protein
MKKMLVWQKAVYLNPENRVLSTKFRLKVRLGGFLPAVEMTW